MYVIERIIQIECLSIPDLSLYKWFIPGCGVIIGVLIAFLSYYAVNVDQYIVRFVSEIQH